MVDKWSGVARPKGPKQRPPQRPFHEITRDPKTGQHMITFPWHQTLPAHDSEVEFWLRLQDHRTLLSGEFLDEWIQKNQGSRTGGSPEGELVRKFAAHVLATADAVFDMRKQQRQKEIEEVRVACGLDPQTGEEIPT